MLQYLGTCIDVDEDGLNYGFDATEFAQAEDRAIDAEMGPPPQEFFSKVASPRNLQQKLIMNDKIWYAGDERLGVLWAYDPDEDIHYIWG